MSDMFGKSATAITDYLTSDESFDPEHCVSLLQRSLKKKAEQVLESIEGFSIASEQKARIKIIREHYDFLEKMIAKVDTCVSEMVEKHEGEINLLCTIPGIDRNSAITIISEMRFYASFSLRRLISTFSKAGSVNHRRIQRPTR